MSYDPDDGGEQPEYQWLEDFITNMVQILITLITLFFNIICSVIGNLFSSEDRPREDSE